MKELSIEEKAKRYDDALTKARNIVNSINVGLIGKDSFEAVFPELAESEDERIRKALIEYFNEQCDMSDWNGVYGYQVIAWLEKQGDANKEYWRGYREGKQEILDKYAELEKQGEQKSYDTCDSSMTDDKKSPYSEKRDFGYFEEKPADKIEPKFHEGNWIVNNNSGGVCQVTEIRRDDKYCLWPLDSEIMGYLRIIDVDNDYHLWTIQDAKDSDVLVFKNNIGGIIICKSPTDYETRSYCRLIDDSLINKEESGWDSTLLVPATKGQRDLLFQKMKEAGYEWDAEKKELKKIEQNSTWSKEDENVMWLLKDIVKHSNEINENIYTMPLKEKLYDWLKSLKDRVQPKQEWSKEDEYTRDIAIRILQNGGDDCCGILDSVKALNWLKSLRPQNHWKPTEEHMRHLLLAAHGDTRANVNYLIDLYNDLKKLRGE